MSAVSVEDGRQHVAAAIDRVLAGPSLVAAPDFMRRLRQEHQVDAVPRVVTVDGVRLLRGFVFRFQGQSYTARSHARGDAASAALGDAYALRQLRRRGLVFNADEHYSDLAAANAIKPSAATAPSQAESISDTGPTPPPPDEKGENVQVPVGLRPESIPGGESCRQAARKVMDALREVVAGDPVSMPAFVSRLRERGIAVEADIRDGDVVELAYLVDGVQVTPTLRGQRSLLVPRADMEGRFTLPELSNRGLVLDRARDVPFFRAQRDGAADLETRRLLMAAMLAAEAIKAMIKRRTPLRSLTAFASGLKDEGVELRGAFRDGALFDLGYAVGGFVTGPRFEGLDASLTALRHAGLTIDPVRDQTALRVLLDRSTQRASDGGAGAMAASLSSAMEDEVPALSSPLAPDGVIEIAATAQDRSGQEYADAPVAMAGADMKPITGAAAHGQGHDAARPVDMLDDTAAHDPPHDDASAFGAPPPEWDKGLAQAVEAVLAEACATQAGRLSLIRGVMALRRAGFHVLPRLSPRGDLESLRCTRDDVVLHVSDEPSAFPLARLRRIGLQDRVPQESIVPVLRSAFQPLDDAAHPRTATHQGAGLDLTGPPRECRPAAVHAGRVPSETLSMPAATGSAPPPQTCITKHQASPIMETDWFDPMIEQACRLACHAYGQDPDQTVSASGAAWGVKRPAWQTFRPGVLAAFARVGISPEHAARMPELIAAAYDRGFAEGQMAARSRS